MKQRSRLLTIDANVFIAALKEDEPHSEKCAQILIKVTNQFQLAEPSVIYLEVCGTLARKTNLDIANQAKAQMDLMINPKLLANCDKSFCNSAFCLCSEYNIYAIDALYLQTALKTNAILVSRQRRFHRQAKKEKAPNRSLQRFRIPILNTTKSAIRKKSKQRFSVFLVPTTLRLVEPSNIPLSQKAAYDGNLQLIQTLFKQH